MDLAEFEAVLKEVAPLAEIVCLHLLGEPLAHPRFSEILDICERYNTQIDLTTNGILIKRYPRAYPERAMYPDKSIFLSRPLKIIFRSATLIPIYCRSLSSPNQRMRCGPNSMSITGCGTSRVMIRIMRMFF
jgi:hypothetical protein